MDFYQFDWGFIGKVRIRGPRARYFNTNNIWLRLSALQKLIDESGGAIKLPVILNGKTVDPKVASRPSASSLALGNA